MDILLLCAFIALTAGTGDAVSRFFTRPGESIGERVAWAWLFGSLIIGALFFVCSCLGVQWTPMVVRIIVVVSAIITWIATTSITEPKVMENPVSAQPVTASPLSRLADAALAVFTVSLLWDALRNPIVAVDARLTWAYHAKIYFHTGTVLPAYLRDPAAMVGHHQYPFVLPGVQAAACLFAGGFSETALRLTAVCWPLSLMVLLRTSLMRHAPRWGSALAAAAMLVPTWVIYESGAADSGLADVPLAAYVFAAALLADRAVRSDERRAVWGAALLSIGAALTKNEGIILAPLASLAILSAGPAARQRRRLAWYLGIFALGVLPWLVARTGRASYSEENYWGHLLAWDFDASWNRAAAILGWMGRIAFLKIHRSALLGWLLLYAVSASFLRTSPQERRLALSIVAYLLVVFISYMLAPWPGAEQVKGSFDRVFSQIVPLMVWMWSFGFGALPTNPTPHTTTSRNSAGRNSERKDSPRHWRGHPERTPRSGSPSRVFQLRAGQF